MNLDRSFSGRPNIIGININVQEVLAFIREQLSHVFGGRITVRQFSDYMLLFEEHYGKDSEGNTLFRSVGMMRLVSDRQVELMTEQGTTTVISDVPMSYNRLFRMWYSVYTWA